MYLHHVTLTTGHSRRSYEAEVGEPAIAACSASLAVCLAAAGARSKLAADLDDEMLRYDLTAAAQGRCLVATVWLGSAPLCTIGVAGHGRCGAQLWRSMHERSSGTVLATRADAPPQAPWCGARLDAGIALDPGAVDWLGDYERCLAWAWLRMLESRRG